MENSKTNKITLSDAFYIGIGLGLVVSPALIWVMRILIQFVIDHPGRVAFSVTGGLITFAFMVFLRPIITRKRN